MAIPKKVMLTAKQITYKSKKHSNDSTARFRYKPLEDDIQNKAYGRHYTARQMRIINGELPCETVRPSELSLLANKALAMGDDKVHQIMLSYIERQQNMDTYESPYSKEEALSILKKLNYK